MLNSILRYNFVFWDPFGKIFMIYKQQKNSWKHNSYEQLTSTKWPLSAINYGKCPLLWARYVIFKSLKFSVNLCSANCAKIVLHTFHQKLLVSWSLTSYKSFNLLRQFVLHLRENINTKHMVFKYPTSKK